MSTRDASLARRLFPAVALTGVGFVVVNSLDHPLGVTNSAALGSDGSIVPNTVPLPGTSAPVTTLAPVTENTQPVTGQSSQNTTPATTPATATPQTTVPSTATPQKTSACPTTSQQGAAKSITHRRTYGTLQVTAKLDANGKLCDVSVNYNVYDGKSQMYAQRALPMLIKRAVNANSAHINGVSGATATSNAFINSLQSAINR